MIDVAGRVIQKKQDDVRVWPVQSNRAGEIGHPCVAYLYFNRTAWSQKPVPSATLMFLFAIGNRIEDEAVDEIKKAGFMVLEQNRPVEWPEYQISGRLDLKIAEKTDGHPIAYPCEIKGLQGYDWARLNTIQDFLDSEKKWLVKYPAQLLTYLLLTNSPEGLFYIKSKATGEPKQIWVKLDDYLDVAEAAIMRAQKVNAYIARKASAEEIIKEEKIEFVNYLCSECEFKHICPVGTTYKGVEIVINEELEGKFKKRASLAPIVKEYEEIDEELKGMFKGKPKTIVGDFIVESKELTRKSYEVPSEIKAQYQKEDKFFRTTIKQLKGATDGENS